MLGSGRFVTVRRIRKPFNPELEGYVKPDVNDTPTMKDIAKACGVSRATVSNVINKKGNVADSTKERVLTAANKLGYQL